MNKTITYNNWKYKNSIQHKKLIEDGWQVVNEEEFKEFNALKGCILVIIFLPLVLFGRSTRIKVTYEKI